MQLTSDWHIHTTHSCDCGPEGAGVRMATLLDEARRRGIADLGISEHIHTPYNLPDLFASRQEFDSLPRDPRFHFGVEVSCVSRWEVDEIESGRQPATTYGLRQGGPAGGPLAIGFTEEDRRSYQVEYVIGGTHWPLYVPIEREAVIRDYHRQNMFLATHPLVTIVAHPWWWMGRWQEADRVYRTDPWFDDFRRIPLSMHDEFAAAAVQHHKVVEINLGACLLNPEYPGHFVRQYVEHLAYLRERGARFSIGSDSHGPAYDVDFETAGHLLEPAGFRDDDFLRLPPRPQES